MVLGKLNKQQEKNILPKSAQKLPRLDIINPKADIKNKIQPRIFMLLLFTNT